MLSHFCSFPCYQIRRIFYHAYSQISVRETELAGQTQKVRDCKCKCFYASAPKLGEIRPSPSLIRIFSWRCVENAIFSFVFLFFFLIWLDRDATRRYVFRAASIASRRVAENTWRRDLRWWSMASASTRIDTGQSNENVERYAAAWKTSADNNGMQQRGREIKAGESGRPGRAYSRHRIDFWLFPRAIINSETNDSISHARADRSLASQS